jgi:tetratricopeptide (TPR) repeat protein
MRSANLIVAVALLVPSGTAYASPARSVPESVLPYLKRSENALEASNPKKALKILLSMPEPKHPLGDLLIGHAYFELKEYPKAETAYERALAEDSTLREATIGLIQAYVAQRHWEKAHALLAREVLPESAPKNELGLYARVSIETGDHRLASLLIEKGILRFPEDIAFRKLDLALLLEQQDWARARDAAQGLLTKVPNDATTWLYLAHSQNGLGNQRAQRAALEAAFRLAPSDVNILRRFALAQLEAGHHQTALRAIEDAIALYPKKASSLLMLGSQVALAAENPTKAQEWLSAVPEGDRNRAHRRLSAMVALRGTNRQEARAAVKRLMEYGDTSPRTLLWAARLAEEAGDMAEAEARYQEVIASNSGDAQLAVLQLSRMLHQLGQTDRAARMLGQHVADHPEDDSARELLGLIRR